MDFPSAGFTARASRNRFIAPDWTSPARLAYTNLLFDLLAELLPPESRAASARCPARSRNSSSSREQEKLIRENLWQCVEHISRVSEKSNRQLHLGLEPEPLGLIENSRETVRFFEQLRAEHKNDSILNEFLGVNYDTCHFAIEFEEPEIAICRITKCRNQNQQNPFEFRVEDQSNQGSPRRVEIFCRRCLSASSHRAKRERQAEILP